VILFNKNWMLLSPSMANNELKMTCNKNWTRKWFLLLLPVDEACDDLDLDSPSDEDNLLDETEADSLPDPVDDPLADDRTDSTEMPDLQCDLLDET